jgi:hypothetical protein
MPTAAEFNEFNGAYSDDASRRSRSKAFCLFCQTIVGLITDEQASNFMQTDLYTLERLAVEGAIHRLHNRTGKVMFCRRSLQIARNKSFTRFLILKPLKF